MVARRTEPFPRDVYRLKKGADAMALPEPRGLRAMREQLAILNEAVCAMQSLDDLGNDEANRQAHADLDTLMRRYEALEQRIGLESTG